MRAMKEILKEYLKAFDVTIEQWRAKNRSSTLVNAHRIFANDARDEGYTWQEIAEACGRKNHSTMIKLVNSEGWYGRNRKSRVKKKLK